MNLSGPMHQHPEFFWKWPRNGSSKGNLFMGVLAAFSLIVFTGTCTRPCIPSPSQTSPCKLLNCQSSTTMRLMTSGCCRALQCWGSSRENWTTLCLSRLDWDSCLEGGAGLDGLMGPSSNSIILNEHANTALKGWSILCCLWG